jgi:tryptophan halogenase
MNIKKICVVGGGTSGLVTALLLKNAHPYLDIDLLESKSVGIIGVGEGSTEHWARFMMNCDISLHELLNEAGATFKYGINFANWNGDNISYIQSVNAEINITGPYGIKYVYANLVSKNCNPLFLTKQYVIKSELPENNYRINQFHFDTFKLNEFLHKKCFKKGIKILEAEIDQFTLTDDGSVKTLHAKDGRILEYDFYVDCTGFSKLILHKTLNIKWLDYSKYLPMNSAIAFPTERLEEIPAWTLSRSMNAGWLWRIPTQDRFGNGYVFSDNFLNFDEALAEVEKLYGHPIKVAKKIKFDTGCLEKSWEKNCVAIGLSSSFIEPLEASAIGTTIQQAMLLCETIPMFLPGNKCAEKIFNKNNDEIFQNILNFIALHYITKRNDTKFWQATKNLPKPSGLEEILEIYKHKFPSDLDFPNKRVLFQGANWILVMHGLGLIDPMLAKKEIEKLPTLMKDNIETHMPPNFDNQYKWISHRQAIDNVKKYHTALKI